MFSLCVIRKACAAAMGTLIGWWWSNIGKKRVIGWVTKMYHLNTFLQNQYLNQMYIKPLVLTPESPTLGRSLVSIYKEGMCRKYTCWTEFIGHRLIKRRLTAGWSSGLKSRNQRSRVEIPVVRKGYCVKLLYFLTSHGCLCIFLSI
jgi:hypothetical protein